MTAAAFDDEGFYRLGDAMAFADPADPQKGLVFNGRLAEDFKLSTGTWVSVGPLRAKILAQAAGLAQDVVIGGPDREFVTALIFPNLHLCREFAGVGAEVPARELLSHPALISRFHEVLRRWRRRARAAPRSWRARSCSTDPPSMEAREVTDKGSINQKAVLKHRAALVDETLRCYAARARAGLPARPRLRPHRTADAHTRDRHRATRRLRRPRSP